MCERCQDFDFPIADIWRPCYQPSRPSTRRLHRYTPGEDDFAAETIIWQLRQELRASEQRNKHVRAELERLKARQPHIVNDVPTFESIKVVNE